MTTGSRLCRLQKLACDHAEAKPQRHDPECREARPLPFFLCIALIIAAAPALHAQSTREDLPPLPDTNVRSHPREAAAGKNPSSLDEFQLLVPAAPLVCWSHSAAENPQGDRNNAVNSDAETDPALRREATREATVDPILGSVAPPHRDP
jgi:hypothetical protein